MIAQDLKNRMLFLFFILSVTLVDAQIKELDMELINDGIVTLRVINNTKDTILYKGKFLLEQKNAKAHIISYKKNFINDSIFYSKGAIWEYFNNELKESIQLKTGMNFIKIPPQTIQEFPFSYFKKGVYYLDIQTFYIYKKKYHFLNITTKEIKIK